MRTAGTVSHNGWKYFVILLLLISLYMFFKPENATTRKEANGRLSSQSHIDVYYNRSLSSISLSELETRCPPGVQCHSAQKRSSSKLRIVEMHFDHHELHQMEARRWEHEWNYEVELTSVSLELVREHMHVLQLVDLIIVQAYGEQFSSISTFLESNLAAFRDKIVVRYTGSLELDRPPAQIQSLCRAIAVASRNDHTTLSSDCSIQVLYWPWASVHEHVEGDDNHSVSSTSYLRQFLLDPSCSGNLEDENTFFIGISGLQLAGFRLFEQIMAESLNVSTMLQKDGTSVPANRSKRCYVDLNKLETVRSFEQASRLLSALDCVVVTRGEGDPAPYIIHAHSIHTLVAVKFTLSSELISAEHTASVVANEVDAAQAAAVLISYPRKHQSFRLWTSSEEYESVLPILRMLRDSTSLYATHESGPVINIEAFTGNMLPDTKRQFITEWSNRMQDHCEIYSYTPGAVVLGLDPSFSAMNAVTALPKADHRYIFIVRDPLVWELARYVFRIVEKSTSLPTFWSTVAETSQSTRPKSLPQHLERTQSALQKMSRYVASRSSKYMIGYSWQDVFSRIVNETFMFSDSETYNLVRKRLYLGTDQRPAFSIHMMPTLNAMVHSGLLQWDRWNIILADKSFSVDGVNFYPDGGVTKHLKRVLTSYQGILAYSDLETSMIIESNEMRWPSEASRAVAARHLRGEAAVLVRNPANFPFCKSSGTECIEISTVMASGEDGKETAIVLDRVDTLWMHDIKDVVFTTKSLPALFCNVLRQLLPKRIIITEGYIAGPHGEGVDEQMISMDLFVSELIGGCSSTDLQVTLDQDSVPPFTCGEQAGSNMNVHYKVVILDITSLV